MNKLLALSLAVTLVAISSAQTIGGAYLLDIKTGLTRPVVITSIGEIRRPLGLGFDLQLDAFAGVNLEDQVYPGFWISASAKLADNVRFKFGPAFTYEAQRVKFPGLVVGFEIRF